MRIAVVTDSTSDLPPALVEAYQIYVIPSILVMDGKSLEDGPGISREAFYRQLPHLKSPPKTASPAAGAYLKLYEKLQLAGYDHVVAIHVASTLSGICNTARAAAQNFNGFIHVVDSRQLSMGLGFQVLAAAEAAAQGAGIETVIAAANETYKRIQVVALLDTLEYARRSGRVSWLQANIGQVLQVKPFMALQDGTITRQGEARSRHKGILRLYKHLDNLGPLEHLAILHSTPDTDAIEMAAAFASQSSVSPVIVQVTPVIGTHVGPNGFGFAAVVR